MGGRGASSGISHKGDVYGTEFATLLHFGNIKFVRYNHSKAATVPLETMSSGQDRVYVLVNRHDILKSIIFYNREGKRRRQIDLLHAHHNKFSPHVHEGYDHSSARELNKGDRAYVQKVRRLWSQR